MSKLTFYGGQSQIEYRRDSVIWTIPEDTDKEAKNHYKQVWENMHEKVKTFKWTIGDLSNAYAN